MYLALLMFVLPSPTTVVVFFMLPSSFSDVSSSAYGYGAKIEGCSDRSREGLFDATHVAGCKGTWSGRQSLRKAQSTPFSG